MYNVNYDLIGSVPSMEIYRDVLPKLIAEYEASNDLAVEARRKIEALGSNHVAIATLAVPTDVVTDDLLGVASRVEVRGIDEIAAELDKAVHDPLGLFDAGSPAEIFAKGHGAQAQRAYAQAGAAECHIMVERHSNSC